MSSYWLLSEHAKELVSDTHIYVFVNIKKDGIPPDFYVNEHGVAIRCQTRRMVKRCRPVADLALFSVIPAPERRTETRLVARSESKTAAEGLRAL